jgi:hypothetical protein
MTEPIKWSDAPDRTSWGASMRVADIEIDRDHTLTLYCEADQIAKVDAMFAEVGRLRAFVEAAIRYAGNAGDDYLADKARAALKELK